MMLYILFFVGSLIIQHANEQVTPIQSSILFGTVSGAIGKSEQTSPIVHSPVQRLLIAPVKEPADTETKSPFLSKMQNA